MAPSSPFPVIALAPLFQREYTTIQREEIYRTYDELPPFTLVLPLQPSNLYEGEEPSRNFRWAVAQTLITLRYTDEVRYLIWSDVSSEAKRGLISENLELLASKCEFLAQW